jgi:hypothetical protein
MRVGKDEGLMTSWQPIETAPRDGTVLRLLCPGVGPNTKPFEAIGRYFDVGAWVGYPENRGLLMPSHWLPLSDDDAT